MLILLSGEALALAHSGAARVDPASQPREAEQRAENRVMQVLERIQQSLAHTSYSHTTRVNERAGSYVFDCSGMTSWVLRRSAPRAHSAVLHSSRTKRPLARDFYHRIAATRPDKARWGWARVARVEDALPGDVIAWLKPPEVRSANTGHVAFIVEPPRPVADMPGAFLVRIADASSYQHEADTRALSGTTGFGHGTILVQADLETGAPVAYGWFGRSSRWILETKLAIGRPLH